MANTGPDPQDNTQANRPWIDRVKGLLQYRDFRLMWIAGGLDNTGRWMDSVVMGLLVLDLTDSADRKSVV